MMGVSVYSDEMPILKNTNAILAFDEKASTDPKRTACIHCGNCLNHCPMRLDPPAIAKAVKLGDIESIAQLKVNLCMECGACVYACPAVRPIVHTHKLAKAQLREWQAEQKKKAEGDKK